MDRLISDLLNLSRVSRTSLNLSIVDMASVAEAMLREVVPSEELKLYDVKLNQMPLVYCDFNLIKQVWQNLIGNAVKYSSSSEIKKIEIGATENEFEITFYIKDCGVGFNDKYMNKLFNVFQRLHRDDEFEGTGVGLAIVKRIILRHNGNVWAEGKVNQGATFYFSLQKNGTITKQGVQT